MININRKQLAEASLMLDGEQFSLEDYPFYSALYQGEWSSTLLMCGRQVGKSVSAAAFSVCESIAIPHFKTLYIAPTLKQTSNFSNTRVSKLVRHSPSVKELMGMVTSDNVFLKVLGNGSELIFNYASDDPDRVRGVSADRVIYDEVQDIDYEAVVPVVNECLANSKYGFVSYMGTPKTQENTIQFIWDNSSQSEWCVKCTACSKYSFYRTTKGIGKEGIECLHCAKYVDPRNGVWVDMKDSYYTKAFHVPQVILPANKEEHRWKRILNKLETYSESKFKNEVLGVSDSVGSRLISQAELLRACKPWQSPSGFICGGVDWSGGGSRGLSRTVSWVFSRSPGGKFICHHYCIYRDINPVDAVSRIAKTFSEHNVSLVIGDAGEGALANSLLTKELQGRPVYQLQYGSNAKPLKWNGVDRYLADRTTLIDCFFLDVKQGRVQFLAEPKMEEAFEDFLALYEETLPSGKKVWRHSPNAPDDSLHAAVFSWVACKILSHDLQFYHQQ
jgi:hypothetical protein